MGWVKGVLVSMFIVAGGALVADNAGLINLRGILASAGAVGDYAKKAKSLGPHRITEADRAAAVQPYCKAAFSQVSQALVEKCIGGYGRTVNGLHKPENDHIVIDLTCEPREDKGSVDARKNAVDCYQSPAWGDLDKNTRKIVRENLKRNKQFLEINILTESIRETSKENARKTEESRIAKSGQRTDPRAAGIKNRF